MSSVGLVALAVRHATRQAVRGFGRDLQSFPQGANSVIDVAFGPGVLVRDASCSLPVGRHIFQYLRSLALYFECSLQLLQTSLKALQSLPPVASCGAQRPDVLVDGLDLSELVREGDPERTKHRQAPSGPACSGPCVWTQHALGTCWIWTSGVLQRLASFCVVKQPLAVDSQMYWPWSTKLLAIMPPQLSLKA